MIIGDLPEDACLAINENFRARVVAVPGCVANAITEIEIIGPIGSLLSETLPELNLQTTWYRNLTWTVNANGTFLMCSKAFDSSYLVSTQTCYTLLVDNFLLHVFF